MADQNACARSVLTVIAAGMKRRHSELLLWALFGCLAIGCNGHAQEVTEEMRKTCLPAVDYEGCIRSFINPPSAREEYDFLGMPKIKEWRMVENRPDNEVWYVNDQSVARVKVRSTYGRYVSYEYVARWNQQATAGRPGYTTTIGSATTNCYGSGYGSVNCTTTPAPQIRIPGRSGNPGGVIQERVMVIIDCLERKAQWRGAGKWESIEGKITSQPIADKWCSRVAELPESTLKDYATGSPNGSDLLATKVLPGSDPELIRKNYATKQ